MSSPDDLSSGCWWFWTWNLLFNIFWINGIHSPFTTAPRTGFSQLSSSRWKWQRMNLLNDNWFTSSNFNLLQLADAKDVMAGVRDLMAEAKDVNSEQRFPVLTPNLKVRLLDHSFATYLQRWPIVCDNWWVLSHEIIQCTYAVYWSKHLGSWRQMLVPVAFYITISQVSLS